MRPVDDSCRHNDEFDGSRRAKQKANLSIFLNGEFLQESVMNIDIYKEIMDCPVDIPHFGTLRKCKIATHAKSVQSCSGVCCRVSNLFVFLSLFVAIFILSYNVSWILFREDKISK